MMQKFNETVLNPPTPDNNHRSLAGSAIIPPGTLRRLRDLKAIQEYAAALAQQAQLNLNQAASVACEDAGLAIPKGANLDLDFNTGLATAVPPERGPESDQ